MSDDDDCVIIEDNLNYKSISCGNIPELFLDKLVAKKHFGRFGKINRFILRPKRLQCTVEYEKEEDAENAFVNAGTFNGQQFDIKYTTNEVAHTRNTEEWVDPDVQAELDAMGNSVRPQSRAPSGLIRPMNIRVPKPILKVSRPLEGIARVDASARSELESILRKPATDIEDRYRILDARDKLIRLTTVRTTDIKKAVSIKGICPDMCPEKERLLREAKHQVSSFELEAGSRNVMDHKIAIKEYSRSSADQETPLTHELRPEPVLNMTMTYLMHRIMDLCDDPEINIGDWYHFVWDRTRSIRKDITQQELCSLGGVQLVEQCARFHIHCAARLVAEDVSVFDQKINTENLTKCLQTLKYMYHDLRLKNIICPNEAEFRAYVVLLNLSDANFLWEIKQLPPEIQNSQDIRTALSIYLAMESNNYIKFFNLVRKTTYLNACILLRYFTQVRLKAIMTIIKAYNSPRHMVSIPLKYFKEILAFESEEATIVLFNYYGLDCDSQKVLLDRTAFYVPDMPFFMERSLNVVEAKRNVSVGEIVCGKKMDSPEVFENHIPHNSFDEEGYLRSEAWTAEDQIGGSQQKSFVGTEDSLFKVPKASPPISPKLQNKSLFQLKTNHDNEGSSMQPPIKPAPPIFALKPLIGFGSHSQASTSANTDNIFARPKEIVQTTVSTADTNIFSMSAFNKPSDIQTSIFGKSVRPPAAEGNHLDSNSFQSSQNTFKTDSVFKHFQEKIPTDATDFIKQSFRGVSPEVDREKQRKEEEEKQRQKENEEKIKKAKEEKRRLAELEKQKKSQEAEERKKEESLRKKKIKEITSRSEKIFKEILAGVMSEEMNLFVSEDLTKFKKIICEADEILNELIEECTIEHLDEVIEEESSILTNNQKVLQKFFQMWRNNVIMQKERRKLIECTPIWLMQESMEETVPKLAHPCQDETLQMMTRYRLGIPGNFNLTNPETKPIDVISLLLSEFRGTAPTNDRGILKSKRYLKIIISMPSENEELEGFYAYFNNWLENNIVRSDTSNTNIFLCEAKENLCVCIRKISGIMARNERNSRATTECDNSDALIFVMTCSNMLDSRRRLHHLLKLSQIYKPIPLAIVVYNSSVGDDFVSNELELDKLIEDEKICSWRILGSYQRVRDEGLKNSLEDSLKFLAQNYNPSTELEMQELPSFINVTLGNEFWSRLNETWAINPSFRKLCTQPNRVIELYNEGIDRVIALLDEDLTQYPEFPAELREFVPQLKCDIPLDIEYFPEDWKIEERTFRVKRFLKKIKLKPFVVDPPEVSKLEKGILEYSLSCISLDKHLADKAGYSAIKNFLENFNNPDLLDLNPEDKMNFVSWLSILKPIALASLTFIWSTECKYLPKEIIYKKVLFNDIISVPWWLQNSRLKTIKMFPAMDEEDESIMHPPKPKRKRTEDDEAASLNDIIARGIAMVEKADKNIENYRKFRNTSREISKSFDVKLYKQEMAVRSTKTLIKDNL